LISFFRHILLLSLCLTFLSACNNEKQNRKNTKQEQEVAPNNQNFGNKDKKTGSKEETNKTKNQDLTSKGLLLQMGFSESESKAPPQKKHQNFCLNTTTDTQKSESKSKEYICKKVSNRLASVSMQSCLAAKLSDTGCSSVNGFPIVSRSFTPINNRQPQAKILIIGGTHADELTSVSTVFKWIEKLNSHHSGLFHWRITPLMNPDGLFRKSATRTNHNGVDLNRNMPTDDWHSNALEYWEHKSGKNPRKYPGEMPSSEPETRWLIDEINQFKPDAIISVHAPYGIVDFDSLILRSAPKSLGKLHLNLLGTYPGSLGNYAGINRNIPVITLELPHAWEMPKEDELNKIWEDIVAWLKINIHSEQKTNKN